MFGLGAAEVAVIIVVALVLLGPERIPPLARAVARTYREFMRLRRRVDVTIDELRRDIALDLDTDDTPEVRPAEGDRVPLDQLHVAQPARELLSVPREDDYLAEAPGEGTDAPRS